MADFDLALARTLQHEGGYVRDPADRGGETYRGIARRYNPGWPGWRRIDQARKMRGFPATLDSDRTLQAAVGEFYKSHYWDKVQGDSLAQQEIAAELFDTAVHLGVMRAVEFLQRALNVLNRNGSLYADLVSDGVFGPRSLAALKSLLRKDQPELLLKIMNVLQGARYVDIMTRSPIQEKYARGWFSRVDIRVD